MRQRPPRGRRLEVELSLCDASMFRLVVISGREDPRSEERGYIVDALREGSCVRNVGRKKKGLVRVFFFVGT